MAASDATHPRNSRSHTSLDLSVSPLVQAQLSPAKTCYLLTHHRRRCWRRVSNREPWLWAGCLTDFSTTLHAGRATRKLRSRKRLERTLHTTHTRSQTASIRMASRGLTWPELASFFTACAFEVGHAKIGHVYNVPRTTQGSGSAP